MPTFYSASSPKKDSSSKKTSSRWFGIYESASFEITDEETGLSAKPRILLWTTEAGEVLDAEVFEDGDAEHDLLPRFKQILQNTPRPSKFCVSSEKLFQAIQRAHSDLLLEHLDVQSMPQAVRNVFKDAENDLARQAQMDESISYFDEGVTSAQVAKFFEATRRFYKQEPWSLRGPEGILFSLSAPSLGIEQGVVCVLGSADDARGLMVFPSFDACEFFPDYMAALEEGQEIDPIPHITLSFESKQDLSRTMQEELRRYAWKTAGANATPLVNVQEPEGEGRGPSSGEISVIESIVNLIVKFAHDHKNVLTSKHAIFAPTTLSADDGLGEQITLAFPFLERGFKSFDAGAFDIDASLVSAEGEPNPATAEAYKKKLLEAFEASDERRDLEEAPIWLSIFLEQCFQLFGKTPVQVQLGEFFDLLFEALPEHAGDNFAGEREIDGERMVSELEAFYAFLSSKYDHPTAQRIHQHLDDELIQEINDTLNGEDADDSADEHGEDSGAA